MGIGLPLSGEVREGESFVVAGFDASPGDISAAGFRLSRLAEGAPQRGLRTWWESVAGAQMHDIAQHQTAYTV